MFFRALSFERKSKDYRILDFLQKIYKKPCTLTEPYYAYAIFGFLHSSMIPLSIVYRIGVYPYHNIDQ
jgi:hypothetical protein